MNNTDWSILSRYDVTVKDLYDGAFQLKMKAEQLQKEGKDATELYASEYRIISALAEMGDPASMILLGELLQGGHCPEQEENQRVRKALQLWQKAAESGEARGYTNIGLVYLHRSVPGGGNSFGDVEYDPGKALSYFVKAYEKGDSKAGRHIGLCYRDGIGTKKDDEKAYQYFSFAAERNDSTATYLKAECLYHGKGTARDITAARQLMKKLVDNNAHDAYRAAEFLKTHFE